MSSQIKHLFDPQRDINRKIEKVVTFGNQSDEFLKQNQEYLKQEISEYIVTDRLKHNFGKILDEMHTGMDSQSREVGIWVSGFYGSGKSSFAKYLGFALDTNKQALVIDGVPFIDRLCERMLDQALAQQLRTLVRRFNPTVFMLDLATQQSSGGNLLPVGTLLYNQVMKWAGYARDTKVAYLERRLENEGRFEEFKALVLQEHNEPWDQLKQDNTFAKSVAGQMAHRFYPQVFPNELTFQRINLEEMEDESERMQQMLNLIRNKTQREYVLFVVDEVGQYVAAKDDLIFHLQGTLQNLKDLGRGKAYFLGTAQQTLTEDDPNARLNSDKLYKLNDRFPIKIDIEASDIKEITTKRLLGKSPEGAATLRTLYSQFGDQLKLHTRLRDVERTTYRSDLDERQFVDLYPFLPQHFNLLINLLSVLAKKTGGLGLRSAIRVVQDVLTDAGQGNRPLADAPVGCLATPAHIYNVLRNDIRKSFQHVVDSVEKVQQVFPADALTIDVAKTIGVLQCLGEGFPVTVENVAVMVHPDVQHADRTDQIRDAITLLKSSSELTLKELDGRLRFMTDAVIRLEEDKNRIDVTRPAMLSQMQEQLTDLFSPPPTTRLLGTKTVKTGIQHIDQDRPYKLVDANEEIQTELHFVAEAGYADRVNELTARSTDPAYKNRLFWLAKLPGTLEAMLDGIVRNEGIYHQARQANTDREIQDYLTSQYQEAQSLKISVNRQLRQALEAGEFFFRGQGRAVGSLAQGYREAAQAQLKTVAEKVFFKYEQAKEMLDAQDTQKVLQFDKDLNLLPPGLNKLGIVKVGEGQVDVSHPALRSIEEYLQQGGNVEGRKLLDHFGAAEFGWGKDTTRYLVALMLLGGKIKLRRAGSEWVKLKGPQAIEWLSNVQRFNEIGIALNQDRQPTLAEKQKAANRLTELTGVPVPPIDAKIAEVALKRIGPMTGDMAPLPLRLQNLGLPGVERAKGIRESIEQCITADGSQATFILSADSNGLYEALTWAKAVQKALDNGLETSLKTWRQTQTALDQLPRQGVLDSLRQQTDSHAETIRQLTADEEFYRYTADINTQLAELNALIEQVAGTFREAETAKLAERFARIRESYDWGQLSDEQRDQMETQFDQLALPDTPGLVGIQAVLRATYSLDEQVRSLAESVRQLTLANEDEPAPAPAKTRRVALPRLIRSRTELDTLITQLQQLRNELADDEALELT